MIPETNIYDLLSFLFFAAVTLGSSLGVVMVKDVWHSALLLGVALLSIAIHYIILSAEFIAAMQILVYVGGILILISFAIMLIRRNSDPTSNTSPTFPIGPNLLNGTTAVLFFIICSFIIYSTSPLISPIGFPEGAQITTSIGYSLFDIPGSSIESEGFIAAFEIVDIALVAALVAAVMLARRTPTNIISKVSFSFSIPNFLKRGEK